LKCFSTYNLFLIFMRYEFVNLYYFDCVLSFFTLSYVVLYAHIYKYTWICKIGRILRSVLRSSDWRSYNPSPILHRISIVSTLKPIHNEDMMLEPLNLSREGVIFNSFISTRWLGIIAWCIWIKLLKTLLWYHLFQ
jgi:hypothetical protein